MFCCPNCFTHTFLKDHIEKSASKTGKCSYCESKPVQNICASTILADLFQPVFDLYTTSSSGNCINEQLQSDWQMFSRSMSSKQQQKLLSDITSDKSFGNQKVITRTSTGAAYIAMWESFKNELLHENRFFPKMAIKPVDFEELLSYLKMKEVHNPGFLYRARVNRNSKPYDILEMGKPPKEKATAGRANPQGIPYFYLASDHKTAISETRPYKSESVCVAKFKVNKKAKFIDLREPKKIICPIGLDEDNLELLYREHIHFYAT